MSKKIELTPDQTKECLKLYNEDLLGSTTISEKLGVHKTIILRTLKENGIILGPSGRRNIGGKPAAAKRYYENNKKTLSDYHKEWSKENRDDLREYHSTWREENKEHVNTYKREYQRKKCAEDPRYRLAARTRTAVWTCLKEANVAKYRSTFDLLGYTLSELINHLEPLFASGMTWENYGEWHVDHKRPMSSFKFESHDDSEFKECWALSNLQPLWGPDNLSKGPRYL